MVDFTSHPFFVSTRNRFVVAILFTILTWFVGYRWLGVVNTDSWARSVTMAETNLRRETDALMAGRTRYGMYRYTHFPLALTHWYAFFIRAGVNSWYKLRFIPLTVSAVSLGFFLFMALKRADSVFLAGWGIVSSIVLFSQMTVYAWEGALYNHSYSLSLALVLMGSVIHESLLKPWWLVLLGFISGWLGYDFIPGQVMCVVALRFWIYSREPDLSLSEVFLRAAGDASLFFSGTALAVLGHLYQNSLFYGSWERAFNDLFGAALGHMHVRRNAPASGSLVGTYSRGILSRELLDNFLWGRQCLWGLGNPIGPRWSNGAALLALAGTAVGLVGRQIVRENWLLTSWKNLGKEASVLGVAIVLAASASFAWIWSMPHHAAVTIVYVPRHLILGFYVLTLLPIAMAPTAESPVRLRFFTYAAWGLPSFALLTVFTLLILRYS